MANRNVFVAPRYYDLYKPENYKKTINFINEIKRTSIDKGEPITIDFRKIQLMTSAAALKTAAIINLSQNIAKIAGMDSSRHINFILPNTKHGQRFLLNTKFIKFVSPNIYKSNAEMWQDNENPFKTGMGSSSQIKMYLEWAKELENRGLSMPEHMNAAISEAYLNVKEHSYCDEESYPPFLKGRWWQYATYRNQTLKFSLLDLGQGIPSKVKKFVGYESISDSKDIEAAMTEGWSSKITEEAGRGRGSTDILKPIELFMEKKIRQRRPSLYIMSGYGQYSYDGKKVQSDYNMPIEFQGTLLEWSFPLWKSNSNERDD